MVLMLTTLLLAGMALAGEDEDWPEQAPVHEPIYVNTEKEGIMHGTPDGVNDDWYVDEDGVVWINTE